MIKFENQMQLVIQKLCLLSLVEFIKSNYQEI